MTQPLDTASDTVARIRVAIADDHPLYRDGIRAMIESLPGMSLVGEATSGETAVELVLRENPDVLLLDLEMPGVGGLGALRRIRSSSASTAVIVVSMHEDGASVLAAVGAGAAGYVSKSAGRTELGRAIATCAAGGVVFGGGMSDQVAQLLARPDDPAARAFPGLTPREREVLTRMAVGENNETIARVLSLSTKTVRNHVSVILSKLAVPDRAAAMLLARDAGVRPHDR